MKKIINNKRYDTDTAKKLAFYQHSNRTDFHFWIERLYQKRTGEFFLHGEGGPASRYAESAGMNEWVGGEKIIPLSYEGAREWAEKYLGADEYEAIFGEVSEDGEKVITTLSISQKSHDTLKRKASESGITMSEYVESLI